MKKLVNGAEVPVTAAEAQDLFPTNYKEWGAIVPRIAKNAIWERATDGEVEEMRRMLAEQPIRIQEIYAGATHISADHELFALLNTALTQAFGKDRAAELLTPTG